MNDTPALQSDVAVGPLLLAVGRNILAEARAAIEDPAQEDTPPFTTFAAR